jgi:peroxiredoxin
MKQSKFSEQKIACVTNVYCVSVAQSYDRRLPAFGKNTGEVDCASIVADWHSRFARGVGRPQETWDNRVTVCVAICQSGSTDWAR